MPRCTLRLKAAPSSLPGPLLERLESTPQRLPRVHLLHRPRLAEPCHVDSTGYYTHSHRTRRAGRASGSTQSDDCGTAPTAGKCRVTQSAT